MVKSKKTARVKTSSAKIHNSKTYFSRRSRINKRNQRIFLFSKRTVIFIIILAMIAVASVIIISSLSTPESITKHKIESITADYYENYFYPRIEENGTPDKTLSEILSNYTETGFSRVTLNQLLSFDSGRYADSAAMLSKYCDINSTYVKIFPDSPFSKSDYHVDYHYACTF